jgi:arylsulfatase A-like enzyme
MPRRNRRAIALLVPILAAVLSAQLLSTCSRTEKPVNVLLISIDMLRPDHLGCYGYARNTSPNIDKLASEGVVFENHVSSSSWTLPAHAAMFTSLPDSLHGCTDTDKKLCDRAITLAQRFARAGYSTVGLFSGPYLHPAFGLGRGFAAYVDCCSNRDELDKNPPEKWAMDENAMKKSHQDITNPTVFGMFERWLAARGDKPFFTFIHMWDVHFDFIPPPPYDKAFDPDYKGTVDGSNFFFNPAVNAKMDKRDLDHILALYDGEIAWTDMFIGKIRESLDKAGLLENTVIAVTSDHGTEFFEHGDKGHRKTLYDEVIRIPLIVRYPARLQPARVSEQSRIIDVGPTLLELARIAAPTNVMGESLLPLLDKTPPPRHRRAVSELMSVGRNMRSLRTLQWKFIDDMGRDTFYYYDLKNDPREQKRLTDGESDACKKLQGMYLEETHNVETFVAQHKDVCVGTSEPSQPPKDVTEQLRGLGYVGSEPLEPPATPKSEDAKAPEATPNTPPKPPGGKDGH